ncbi:cell surface glycoprotein CD200 receptor 1 [Elgaria multicarinata webbii]|uniref:cell surface glycoprotein CD200 receptor 1 n=1 Tax=Elgaria multicarinata webbii TaxID=159646 RepID=UPI002FCCFB22
MEAKTGVNFVMKSWGASTLITVTVAMATIGPSLARGPIQNNFAVTAMMATNATSQEAEGKSSMSAVVGTDVVLNCPQQRYDLLVWNVKLKNGRSCHISYESVRNMTDKNCSKNTMWSSRPDQSPDVHIKSSQLFNEGIYKCSVVATNGTFNHESVLTILVPPEVSLTHDIHGSAVCKAAAGKPAAKISWAPPQASKTVMEAGPSGTQTITSTYNNTNATEGEVTCFISHPAWKESRVLNISIGKYSAERNSTMRILYSSLTGLFGILVILLFIYFWRVFYGRQTEATTSKSPETISRQSIQENELEPYATFVQVENVIYDKACDFSQGECFPPGLSPST